MTWQHSGMAALVEKVLPYDAPVCPVKGYRHKSFSSKYCKISIVAPVDRQSSLSIIFTKYLCLSHFVFVFSNKLVTQNTQRVNDWSTIGF